MNVMKTAPNLFNVKNSLRISMKIILIFSVIYFSACVEQKTAETENSNTPKAESKQSSIVTKDNTEELAQLVKIPFVLEDVDAVWRIEPMGNFPDGRVPGPTDQKLRAVFLFYPDDAAKLVAEAERLKAGSPVTIDNETWFPPELTGKGELSGDDTLKGIEYPANQFFQSPYLQGRLVRVEGTDYFLLELTTN